MATNGTIAQILAMLSIAYPGYEIAAQTPEVYAALLADVPDDVLVAAAQKHATTSKWFPKIAELREAAQDIQARATGMLTAEESWLEVQAALRDYGWYGETIPVEEGGGWRAPSVLDELSRRAIEGLGGWRMMCQSNNPVADRAHYLKIYAGLLRRHQEDAAMLPQVREVVEKLAERKAPAQLRGEPAG